MPMYDNSKRIIEPEYNNLYAQRAGTIESITLKLYYRWAQSLSLLWYLTDLHLFDVSLVYTFCCV